MYRHAVIPRTMEHRIAEHGMSEHHIWNSKSRTAKPVAPR